MITENLKKDIFYLVKEEQVKLGYQKGSVRLYYPVASILRLLEIGSPREITVLKKELDEFCSIMKADCGEITYFISDERVCICVSEAVSEYIHLNTQNHGFIYDFINAIAGHSTIMQIKDVFQKYSKYVHFEKTECEDFDYLIYFEKGEPDDSYFCIKQEGCHMIYHRFCKVDYEELYK